MDRIAANGGEDRTTVKTYNVLFLCTGNSARSIMAQLAGALAAAWLHRWLLARGVLPGK